MTVTVCVWGGGVALVVWAKLLGRPSRGGWVDKDDYGTVSIH